jgi:nitrogen-specific signal transduction histidine kinase
MKKSRKKHTQLPPPETPESMAALAEGMADNFNNILTTVMGACSLIDRDDPANVELLQYVALIRASAERAAALSDRLMRAGISEQENANSDSHPQDSGSADTSVRDKKSTDDVLSPD